MRLVLAALLILSARPAGAQTRVPVPNYDVSVVLTRAQVDVDVQVTIPARATAVDSVLLRLDRRTSNPEVALLSSADVKVTTTRDGGSLTVMFAPAIPVAQPLALRLRYTIGAVQTRGFYVAEAGAYFSGESFYWYPLPSDSRRAKGRLRFTTPAGFAVAATGRRAAGTGLNAAGDFSVDDATTFSFAIGRHTIHRSNGSPAVALHLLRSRPLVRERLELLRKILSATVAEFGPYPHPDLEVVEMPEAAAGPAGSGTSLEGFVVVAPDVMDSFNVATIAHEVSHQWWVDSVFGVGAGRVLIGDGMAEYGALRAVEAIYGERAAADFRWNGYPGVSLFGGGRGYLTMVSAGLDVPLTGAGAPTTLAFRGALAHDLLSRTVGRQAFRAFLAAFTRDHRFQDTTWSAFVDAAAVRFGDRVRTFVRAWYDQAGVPALNVAWTQQAGQLRGTVTQDGPMYDGEIEIVARGGNRQRPFRVKLTGARTEFSTSVRFMVTDVTVDPDYKIPNRNADRLDQALVIESLGRAVVIMREGGSDFTTAVVEAMRTRANPPPEQRFLLEVFLADEAWTRGDTASAKTHMDAAIATTPALSGVLPGLYYSRAKIAAEAGDRDVMAKMVQAAVRSDAGLSAPSGWGLAARELVVSTSR
jgi:hypothetical protein